MKKLTYFALFAAALLFASTAGADSLDVNGTAALGGSFGLELLHDNTSPAYVQDDSPNGEQFYRFEFLYNPNFIGPTGSGAWRMTIFAAMGANPRPDNAANPCPLNPNIPVFPARIFAAFDGPGVSVPGLRMTLMSNQCGIVGTPVVYFTDGVTQKVCGFLEIGEVGVMGSGGLAIVGESDPCPPHGDGAYGVAQTFNQEHAVDFARLGNIALNPYNRGEDGSVYLDEFASFRTMAP